MAGGSFPDAVSDGPEAPASLAASWAERLRSEPIPAPPVERQAFVDPAELQLSAAEVKVRERVQAFIETEQFEPPPLPAIAQEILDVCATDNASAARLAEIAHRDSFIAGRVLKLANSAFFRRAVEARTLREAIVRIGQNELRNLVLAVVLKGETFNVPPAREFALLTWRHSLASALGASLIASETGWAEAHRAFLAGLLHDVGKAVVLHAFDQLYRERSGGPPREMAPVIAHSLHTEVGALVAKAWRLDDGLREVMTLHHAPAEAVVDEKLCGLVAFADALVAEVGLGDEPRLPDISTHPIGLFMGYTEDRLWDILDRIVHLLVEYDVE